MKRYLIIISVILFTGQVQSQGIDYITMLDEVFNVEQAKARMDVFKNEELMKYYEMDFYRKDNKVRMDFTGPAVEKGRRMLDDEINIWMYMPRTSKVMKVPLKQTFMGSDASNRDVFRLNFSRDYDLAGTTPGENGMILIELNAKDQSVAYSKVIFTFDIQNRVPVQQEMYTLSGRRIKVIEYSQIISVEGRNMPTLIIIKDELQKNTYTRLEYNQIKAKGDKAAEFFTLGGIKR